MRILSVLLCCALSASVGAAPFAPGARVAFLGRQPYSAEFYMPGLLASTNAPNVHLLVSTRKLKRKGDSGRPHLRAANGWTLLGPMPGDGK